jgi:predicted RNA binding protein YcfA (HicA-like mRNA interferase family)
LTTKLPALSAREVIKALAKIGYVYARQHGSHIILVNKETRRIIVVPNDAEIPKGTLRAIITEAGLTVDQFVDFL